MESSLTISGVAIAAIYIVFRAILHFTQDAKEPLAIGTIIPFISPVLGMLAHKSKFYVRMRDQYDLPIYTLRLPGTRIYVVNSTAFIQLIQRQFRTLAFAPIEAKAAANIMGASRIANEILSQDLISDEGYIMSFGKAIHPAVSPGNALDAMNRASVEVIAESLKDLYFGGSSSVRMFEWIRHEILSCTTKAVYGPQNPFQDSTIEASWYDFEPGVMTFMLKLLPTFLAQKSYRARSVLAERFEHYFRNGDHEQGSALVRCRFEHSVGHQIPVADIARFEIGGAFALLANTPSTAFWVIYHLYADESVLEDCRREVTQAIIQDKDGHCTIDLSDIKSFCPTLFSTFQEVMRFHIAGVSSRVVLQDHMLDNKYLLKQGSIVMVPGPVQHSDRSIWGPNAGDFDYKRFIWSGSSGNSSGRRPDPVAFRGFGGGKLLCPGRHFASTQILAFAVLMIIRFDVRPIGGKWFCPKTDKAPAWATIPAPDSDIEVEIIPRSTREIKVSYSSSDKPMGITAEDVAANEK